MFLSGVKNGEGVVVVYNKDLVVENRVSEKDLLRVWLIEYVDFDEDMVHVRNEFFSFYRAFRVIHFLRL
ncbi:hypothetical protein, partial [Staphylococcus saprophyticus]|uniref:hypothetical protein n=1 Tax=Staphylococcus saprophyticus TaxID=29385 RepID=UPI001C9300B7